MKTEIDQDVDTPKLLLKAVNTLIEARPVEQLEHAIGTLYEFYSVQKQPVGGAIVRAVDIIKSFLRTVEEITTIPGPVNGDSHREFENIGKKLKVLRIAAGKEEDTVADTIGIELSLLQRIEKGQCGDMRIALLEEFSKYFNVPVSVLFNNQ
ncbi:helix-turn-helix domain-containing protein [Fulvivirgaceae bacterium PWU5]|uniref:Helix-turn-helix domain-containing protein n=1 Tax=Dawidia cretensis TaxID=2782350 RepID=A0AAP2E3H1_9BACT|nr:helix-turn-helix transcriptional regulator [Dawidia cretensis]MBT1712386.1 helix-turn-helix domain-containing protein [Dawidia cretensis]